MECGGKRSATPLWLERLVLRWIRHKHKPKRRRASLAAALHMAVADTFNRTRGRFRNLAAGRRIVQVLTDDYEILSVLIPPLIKEKSELSLTIPWRFDCKNGFSTV